MASKVFDPNLRSNEPTHRSQSFLLEPPDDRFSATVCGFLYGKDLLLTEGRWDLGRGNLQSEGGEQGKPVFLDCRKRGVHHFFIEETTNMSLSNGLLPHLPFPLLLTWKLNDLTQEKPLYKVGSSMLS